MQGEQALYTNVHWYIFANHVAATCASRDFSHTLRSTTSCQQQVVNNDTTTTTTTTTQKSTERDLGGIRGNGVSTKMREQAQKVRVMIVPRVPRSGGPKRRKLGAGTSERLGTGCARDKGAWLQHGCCAPMGCRCPISGRT